MFWGKYGAGGRLVFSLLMALMLVMTSAPVAFAQEATPEAPVVEEEPVAEPAGDASDGSVVDVTEPMEASAEEPAVQDAAPAQEPDVQVAEAEAAEEEPVVEAAEVVTKEVSLDPIGDYRCSGDGPWRFIMMGNPGPEVQSITVTFANGQTVDAARELSDDDRAVFDTQANRYSEVVSAVAVVPADFEVTSFALVAGYCNEPPVEGDYTATVVMSTNDMGSAEGALVTIVDDAGNVVSEGEVVASGFGGGTYVASDLPPGVYTVTVDGRPAGYNVVSQEFAITSANVAVRVDLRKTPSTTIEFQVQETLAYDNARIPGVNVVVHDMDGNVVAEGVTDDNGVFRATGLPLSTYTATVDGTAQGYYLWTGEVSTLAGSHTMGVVLERMPVLSGFVVDAVTGSAIANARVTVVDQDGQVLLNETTVDGSFAVRGLVTGSELVVSVSAPGYLPSSTTYVVGDGDPDVSIALTPVENVKKTIVITVDPEAMTDTSQLVAPDGATWTLTEVRKNGKAKTFSGEFSGALPQEIELSRSTGSGTFTLTVDAEGFEPYIETVTVVGDEGALYVELVPMIDSD